MTIVNPGKNILWVIMSAFYLMSPVVFAEQSSVEKTTMHDVKQEMKEAANAIKNYSIAQRDEAVKAAKSTLDNLDAEIERLEDRLDEKTDRMDQATRQKARATLKTLRKERNKVAEWYGSMQHSSAGAWQEIKTGFLKSYQTLQESFDKAQQEFQQ
jgi:chromosome segregation ATPase